MAHVVDARGLSCPQPVIKTRAAMAEGGDEVTTIVDNAIAANNVSRMAEKAGWSVNLENREAEISLRLTHVTDVATMAESPAETPMSAGGPTVLLVKSNQMSAGDDELGQILIRGLFHTLLELEEPPATIIFLNSGVKLVTKDSPALEDIEDLERGGVEILACGTCLNFFGLTEQLGAGTISNMYTIVETLMAAGRIVSP